MNDSTVIVIPRREVVTYINESSVWIIELIFNTSKLIIENQIKDDELFGGDSFTAVEEKFILEGLKLSK